MSASGLHGQKRVDITEEQLQRLFDKEAPLIVEYNKACQELYDQVLRLM